MKLLKFKLVKMTFLNLRNLMKMYGLKDEKMTEKDLKIVL